MSAVEEIPIDIIGVKLEVVTSTSVQSIWKRFQQKEVKSSEACGILIGGYSSNFDKIYVEQCTMPGKLDCRTRFGFMLRSPHHQRAANKAFKKSDGRSFYLGTWHTHPCAHPTPSPKDLKDWKKCMQRNEGFELFAFAIVGTESAVLHIYRNLI